MARASLRHRLMDRLLQDLRYALRTLARTPAWTVMAALTLALGTGANAAVFSFVDALLFKPAPGLHPARPLVSVFSSDFSSGPYGDTSYEDFVSMGSETQAFAALAALDDSIVAPLRVGDDVQRVRVARVTATYFEVLGIRMSNGRGITAADIDATATPAAVISDNLWRRALGSTPLAIGSTIIVNGRAHVIVGIAPPRFTGVDLGRSLDVWVPLVPTPRDNRGNRGLNVVGQLGDGVSLAAARAELKTLAGRLAREYPDTNLGTLERPREPRPFAILPLRRIDPNQRGDVVAIAAVLMGGVGLVLLLACANVASLLLARTTARAREIAVRRALGAGSGRLLRQLLTESAVLAALSAGLGLLFAAWTADVLPSFFPAEQAMLIDAAPGWRVALFALALAAVAAVLVGLVPAVRAVRPPLAASLRGAAGDITARSASRARTVLVATQVAIACVLLVTAALLVQSVANQRHADLGFTTRNALLLSVDVPSPVQESNGIHFYQEARERAATLPGVADVAWARTLPLALGPRRGFRPEGYVPRAGEDLELNYNTVSPSYFSTLGIALLGGRVFDLRDRAGAAPVVVVNDALAKRFFQGAAVGRHLKDSSGTVLEIVGIVRSSKYLVVSKPAPPTVYYPLAQAYSPRMSMIVRTERAPEPLAESLRREIRATSADVPVFRTVSLSAHVEEALSADRLSASLVSACGLLAALLAIVGLYGAVAYLVSQRTREIGVRIALGAQPRHVIALVVRHGAWIAGTGIVAGLAAATAFGRLLASMLYGVSATDVATHAAVAVVLASIAGLGAYLPARRAARIDPARAISHE
jgi:predicted permease